MQPLCDTVTPRKTLGNIQSIVIYWQVFFHSFARKRWVHTELASLQRRKKSPLKGLCSVPMFNDISYLKTQLTWKLQS